MNFKVSLAAAVIDARRLHAQAPDDMKESVRGPATFSVCRDLDRDDFDDRAGLGVEGDDGSAGARTVEGPAKEPAAVRVSRYLECPLVTAVLSIPGKRTVAGTTDRPDPTHVPAAAVA